MSLLTQCPRCSFTYVRRSDDPTDNITCRRCQTVFSVTPKRSDPAAPTSMAGAHAPIVVSAIPSGPTDFVIESLPTAEHVEIVHEVEHIEVLDETAAEEGDRPLPAGPLGSLELDLPALRPIDDVEVIEAAPPRLNRPPAPLPMADEVVADPLPTALPFAAPVFAEPVEVVQDPVPPPALPHERPIPIAFLPEAELLTPIQPPPVRRSADDLHLDIRKRTPRDHAAPQLGVWLGLGIGFLGLLIVTLVIVLVLRAGGPTPVP